MKFEIKKFDAAGRLGIITHNGKNLLTPNLLPVVSPFENIIPPKVLYDEFKVSALFTNAYILYNNKEKAQQAESLGLHSYLDYDGLIATDSGAFQHYMYGNESDITAEEIELFQERIQSDFPVILDIPVQLSDTFEIAHKKMLNTIKRAKENIQRRNTTHGAWYGPVHGTLYPEILEQSCKAMNELDFGVYAIGGIVKAMNDYAFDVCVDAFLTVKKYLRKDKPVHMFGLGLPQFFSLAVATGADLMDSAAYILFAKQGRYFSLEGTRNILDLTELPCSCPVCSTHNASEIASLFEKGKKEKYNQGIELLARHNLHVSFAELKTIRESIRSGNLWELVEQRIQSHPKLVTAYQKITNFSKICEEQIPIEKKKGQFLTGPNSLSRPIFTRMPNKIQNTYQIQEKSVLLLIPELNESLFNSHYGKDWINSIETIISTSILQLEPIVVSSYYGIIPLDLYGIYPFSQRDWVTLQHSNNRVWDSIFKFFQKHRKNIEQIIILRPNSWITPYNQEEPLLRFFLDDIIDHIMEKKNEIFGRDILVKMVSDITELS
jgi:7-cyano-7-deazaguanine tRNA-ribosyltransferase